MLIRRNKIWHYQTKINGRTFRRSTGQTDKRAAHRKALEFRKSVQLRKTLSANSRASTLHAAIAEETQRIEADVGPRQATRSAYCFLNFAKYLEKDVRLENLAPDVLQFYQRWRASHDIAGATIHKELHALYRLLHEHNPEIRKPKAIGGAPFHPNRAFTDPELSAIFAVAPPELYDLCLVLLTTGARPAEVLPSSRSNHVVLLKTEVHYEAGKTIIRTAKQRDNRWSDPRVVSVPTETLEALRRQAAETLGPHVFAPMVNPSHQFQRCLRRAKVPYLDALGRKVTLHSFRHTYSTKMAEIVGHNAFVLQRILGHHQIGTTAHYCTPAAPPAMINLDFLRKGCQKGCQEEKKTEAG